MCPCVVCRTSNDDNKNIGPHDTHLYDGYVRLFSARVCILFVDAGTIDVRAIPKTARKTCKPLAVTWIAISDWRTSFDCDISKVSQEIYYLSSNKSKLLRRTAAHQQRKKNVYLFNQVRTAQYRKYWLAKWVVEWKFQIFLAIPTDLFVGALGFQSFRAAQVLYSHSQVSFLWFFVCAIASVWSTGLTLCVCICLWLQRLVLAINAEPSTRRVQNVAMC